jgi:hypothetical protein
VLCVDWDGTCVRTAWPDMGEWLPGAIQALTKLSHHYTLVVYSARMAAVWPDGSERRADEIATQAQLIRSMLDGAGLTMVRLHPAAAGKPHAVAYIDNKALRFGSERRSRESWEGLVDRLLTKVGVDAGA